MERRTEMDGGGRGGEEGGGEEVEEGGGGEGEVKAKKHE